MAKIASTINIEEMFWNEIKLYMLQNNITNRNTAIEYMLLERRTLLSEPNDKTTTKPKTVVNEVVKEKEENDFIMDAIDNNFDNMFKRKSTWFHSRCFFYFLILTKMVIKKYILFPCIIFAFLGIFFFSAHIIY